MPRAPRRGLAEARGGTSGEGARRPADRRRISAAGSTVLLDLGLGYLSLERSTPDAFARRTAAPAAGDAGAFESVRRRLRARRAVGRAASGRHRGAADGARPAEGLRQFAVRRRARAGRHPACRLDRRRRARRRRARRRGALQRSARGLRAGRAIADPPLSLRRPASRQTERRARPRAGCGCAASRATTCTSSTSTFRSACSRP